MKLIKKKITIIIIKNIIILVFFPYNSIHNNNNMCVAHSLLKNGTDFLHEWFNMIYV